MGQIWKLKKNAELRIRQGHPWVFDHEIDEKPRSFIPQQAIDLVDSQGNFLARGYGNPQSKIIFRALTFDSRQVDVYSFTELQKKIMRAWRRRAALGFRESFRLFYSEGDEFPGLIIDRYTVHQNNKKLQVFSMQVLTAGAELLMKDPLTLLKPVCEEAQKQGWSQNSWDETVLVLRNDVRVREAEGLKVEPPRFLKTIQDFEPQKSQIRLQKVLSSETLSLECDLYEGQKTGFFLDQVGNISLVVTQLEKMINSGSLSGQIRIIDLCSYVGHWSAQIGAHLKKHGIHPEITLVDVSMDALQRASKNVQAIGLTAKIEKKDVLKELDSFESGSYDIVVADPPAFIKSKKDLAVGRAAYLKFNTHAFRLARSGGLVISCSCSGSYKEDDFKETLRRALWKSGRSGSIALRGGVSSDHPLLVGFPEGHYLKMLTHLID